MRFLEIVILLLAIVAMVTIFLPNQRRQNPTNLILFTVALALVHLALEGYRWQMVPTYLFLGLLFLVRRKEISLPAKSGMGLWWGVSILLPVAVPVPDFPNPTGQYAVGSVTYHWIDTTRSEWFTEESDDVRELMVQFWYPTDENPNSDPIPLMDHLDIRASAVAHRVGIPSFMLGHMNLAYSHSVQDAHIATTDEPFPVVIFSHGLGGMRTQNTVLMEELASHGYVVVAMDHPYDCNLTIFPDGRTADYLSAIPDGTPDSIWIKIRSRQLETRVRDVQFVLDQLERINSGQISNPLVDHINLDRIGAVGHSFGGATAVALAMRDSRIQACATLDGWFVPFAFSDDEIKLDQPFFYIGQTNWPSWNEPRHRHYLDLLLQKASKDKYRFSVVGAKHFDFADFPLLSPLTWYLGLTGFPDGRRIVEIVNSYTLAFFDQYLKGKVNPLLEGESPYVQVVITESRQ